jgi:AsmA protein
MAIGIAAALLFDPEDYRPQLVDAVSRSTGRAFELDGPLRLDLLPCCAVALGGARLGSPPEFPGQHFATFESASARIRIWPLLVRREVEIGALQIEGLHLNFVRLPDGRGNWRFAAPPRPENAEGPDRGGSSPPLRIDAFDASAARVDYRDLGNGNVYTAADVAIRTGAVTVAGGTFAVTTPWIALTAMGTPLPVARAIVELDADRITLAPAAGTFEIPRFALRLDDSRFTGHAALDPDRGLRFDVAVDSLDADRYLPRANDAPGSTPRDPAEPTRIPLDLIRRLHVDGKIRAGELVMFRTRLTDVEAGLRGADGVLTVDPLSAALYAGTAHGKATVDARGEEAVVRLDQQISAIQVGELLESRFDRQVLAGRLNLVLDATGRGRTTREIMGALNGAVDVDLADGVYRGTDFLYEIRRAAALLRRRPAPQAPAHKETPIQSLEMSGRLVDGVMRSDRIDAVLPALHVTGTGDLDLLSLVVDYRFRAELVEPPADMGATELEGLDGHAIPFTVRGPARAPKVNVDLDDLLKDQMKGALQRGLRKLFGSD